MNFFSKNYNLSQQFGKHLKNRDVKNKKQIALIMACMLTIMCWAQNGINYKGIIKDAGGNLIVSGSVTLVFKILETSAIGSSVYSEEHITMTDSNGVVIVTIGEGSIISGVFNDIDWRGDRHFLNVQADINDGSGLIDLNTSEFKSVPYALNVTGLEALDEGSGKGWRLIARDPTSYGNIGNNAVDFSTQVVMPDIGATGASSFAAGEDTYALGQGSVAFGFESTATNLGSFVGGFDSTSSGTYSFAYGNDASASDKNAVAFGHETIASGPNSFAIGVGSEAAGSNSFTTGNFSLVTGDNATSFGNGGLVSADNAMSVGSYNEDNMNAIFMVGNGATAGSRANALEVLKDGSLLAPSLTNTLINTTGAKALVTKEYVDSGAGTTGLELVTEAGESGWRLVGRDPSLYSPIGRSAIDFSNPGDFISGPTGIGSFTAGLDNWASGDRSAAFGRENSATGENSFAIGVISQALEDDTFAGAGGTANKVASFAWTGLADGIRAVSFGGQAKGSESFAIGAYSSVADAYYSFAMGRNNVGGGNPTTWVDTDPLFEIGNGSGSGAKNNAITVLKNGKVGVGTATPLTSLHVNHPSGTTNGLSISNVFDNDRWHFYTWTTNDLFLYFNNAQKASIDDVSGIYTALSDRNTKKNIISISSVLDKVVRIEVVDYNFKNQKDQRKYVGMIAQDLEQLFPHLVYKTEGDAKNSKEPGYMVDYSGFGVLAIKAIQEQQKIIKKLEARIEALENK